jgi:two-component system CheB/CheR fusion protein
MPRTMGISDKAIRSRDGHGYRARVMPYRALDDCVQGALITFIDIAAAKQLGAQLRRGPKLPAGS